MLDLDQLQILGQLVDNIEINVVLILSVLI